MVVSFGYDDQWRGCGWFVIFFMACSVKISDGVRIKGVSARTFSTRLYGKLW